ncbi:MAG TPA: SOS response-associated peptidase [Stellaceae bacterium]|jgi:putative SOS response-associated peptidase YedK|nr:SOS response-associated peptidase [Stellaceae bacterium]
MCGRYLLKAPADALRRAFGFVEQPNLMPRYNIAPTQDAAVIRERREPKGERTLQLLRWGLIPSWAEDMKGGAKLINARAEGIAERPSFREAFRRRRCLVPADGFYEWRTEGRLKQPYLIQRRDRAPIAFAGLWERWVPKTQPPEPAYIDSFTIVTTAANALLKPLHERMPVILAPENCLRWLDRASSEAELKALLRPAPEDLLAYVLVSTRVNAAAPDDAGLIEPVGLEVVA